MRGIILNPPAAAEERGNWRILSDTVDELYFRRRYQPGIGHYGGGAAVNFNSRAAVVDFPAAGSPAWRLVEERAARWRRAGIFLRVRYTTNAAGGGNFAFRLFVGNFDAGDNLATIGLYTAALTLVSPAAASDIATAEYVDTTATIIPGSKGGVVFLAQRLKGDASDTSANVLQVLSLQVKVLPQG